MLTHVILEMVRGWVAGVARHFGVKETVARKRIDILHAVIYTTPGKYYFDTDQYDQTEPLVCKLQ